MVIRMMKKTKAWESVDKTMQETYPLKIRVYGKLTGRESDGGLTMETSTNLEGYDISKENDRQILIQVLQSIIDEVSTYGD